MPNNKTFLDNIISYRLLTDMHLYDNNCSLVDMQKIFDSLNEKTVLLYLIRLLVLNPKNKYIIIDTDTFLHKEGFVSSFCKTIDEAKEIAIKMLNKSGPRKLYIAEILSHNKDVCEYKMYDIENNPDFNLFDIDVSKINNQEIFNSSLYEAILANKEIEFYIEMFMYYNNNKCLNFLLNFT